MSPTRFDGPSLNDTPQHETTNLPGHDLPGFGGTRRDVIRHHSTTQLL